MRGVGQSLFNESLASRLATLAKKLPYHSTQHKKTKKKFEDEKIEKIL